MKPGGRVAAADRVVNERFLTVGRVAAAARVVIERLKPLRRVIVDGDV